MTNAVLLGLVLWIKYWGRYVENWEEYYTLWAVKMCHFILGYNFRVSSQIL